MDAPADIFEEFHSTVNEVLRLCTDHEVILNALKDLAEGKRAALSDGITIQPLRGLGSQSRATTPEKKFEKTMSVLLSWGIRTFPVQPSQLVDDLWVSMTIFDGPKGYNQRLFTDGLFFPGGINLETGLFRPRIPRPTIITSYKRSPIKLHEEDLQFVIEFLNANKDSRSVVVASSKFGWQTLSVDCVCLYVDADTITGLAVSVSSRNTTTIIANANVCPLTDTKESARELLEPPGLDKVALSERNFQLRKNRQQLVRWIDSVGPFKHGQSISLLARESKGSVSVFLSPNSPSISGVYGLTAYHVLPFKEDNETRVITPGGLDILTRLLDVRLNDHDRSFLLSRWYEQCGVVKFGAIGSNSKEWRTDFALFKLDNEFQGVNGTWFDEREMVELFIRTEKQHLDFTGKNGVVGNVDAEEEDICYTDGASSGSTVGRIGLDEVLLFEKSTLNIAEKDAPRENIDKSMLRTFHPIKGQSNVCQRGDSGCGVFCPMIEADGWNWVGQVVQLLHVEEIPDLPLMIPQSEIMRSLKEATGVEWNMSTQASKPEGS
ncbi:hypothetical protein V8E54_013236 [Elaphomyces granulatus]